MILIISSNGRALIPLTFIQLDIRVKHVKLRYFRPPLARWNISIRKDL